MVMSEGQVLSTAFGRVLGDRVGGVLRYRGVPFAGRLDGAARWMPPSWPEPWDGVRPALVNAAPVPQNPPSYDEKGVAYHAYLNGPRDTVPVSEEGLFLNLWTPSLDPQARRPIMIYIHGGGFELGSPSSPRTQGDRLAAAGDVVVISAAHRLNVPGYLYLDEISGGKHRTANLGLLDLVHLLHWVADHASAFGGDADNVTLFGESGGGMKISALTMMPAARGLFRRGICQAGVMAPPARTGARFGFLTPAQATERSLRLIQGLGVDPTPQALGALDWRELLARNAELARPFDEGPAYWRPVLDDRTLSVAAYHDPAQALPVDLLLGTTTHEGDFFMNTYKSFASSERLREEPGRQGPAIVARYLERFGNPEDADAQLIGDWVFRMPTLACADQRALAGRKTWLYQFDWRRQQPPFRPTHGSEGPFIFGTGDVYGFCEGAEEVPVVTALVQSVWLSFARQGVPADALNGAWAPHVAGSNLAYTLRCQATPETGLLAPVRQTWLADAALPA